VIKIRYKFFHCISDGSLQGASSTVSGTLHQDKSIIFIPSLIIQFMPCLGILYRCSVEHLLVEIVPTCDMNDNTLRCVWSLTIVTYIIVFCNVYSVNMKLNMWPVFSVITLLIYDAGLNGLL